MSQNYVLVQRALTTGVTIRNNEGGVAIQNAGEFVSYLNEVYLSQGYEILSINMVPNSADVPVGTIQYAYHLVKTVADPKAK